MTNEQFKEVYIKVEMSRMLLKMSQDMVKQIEEDIKFYNAIVDSE
jgi:hypothetical protein